MAKPKPPIITETRDHSTTDHGIYADRMINCDGPNAKQLVTSVFKGIERNLQTSPIDKVKKLQEAIRVLLRQCDPRVYVLNEQMEVGRVYLRADLGEGTRCYSFTADRDNGVEQAADALEAVNACLASNPTPPQAELFLSGVRAGCALEKMNVLSHEPDALAGKKSREGGRAGAVEKHGTPDEIAAQQKKYRQEFDSLWPSVYGKREMAYRVAGQHCGVSAKTIERAVLENKSPDTGG